MFSVSGRVKYPGFFEVETGLTVRNLIEGFCGGMLNDKPYKAALLGGVLPERLLTSRCWI
ncbi:MAG: hypothetical protein EOM06_13050 [Sphingobacteriia bacterium]|nr:hypothetical protein [Sphingobacteriia bacterium]